MNPQIQYVRTSDGVSIAYATAGNGPPYVLLSDPAFSHLQYEFALNPVYRDPLWQHFLTQRTGVRFDPRGVGLSTRDVERFGLDDWLIDLEAVTDRLAPSRFALHSTGAAMTPVAIAYAVRHPDRVSHLVLQGGATRAALPLSPERVRLFAEMLNTDWEMFTENVAALLHGWGADRARLYAEYIRAATSPETFRRVYGALATIDATDLLEQLQTPTLIFHNQSMDPDVARETAARIPDARLVVLDGPLSDSRVAPIVLGFLEGREPTPPPAASHQRTDPDTDTAVILFADTADSTALTERLGDAAFREKARDLEDALRRAIVDAGGMAVEGKLLGDGVLATFVSARDAIDGALRCAEAGDGGGLPLHLGVHAGDVIRERGNIYGGAVNIAARVSNAAAPGEVLVSDIVRGLARTSAGMSFEDRGDHNLKGIADPVRLYAVRPQDA